MSAVLYWCKERLWDAWLWPLNLVRDFPARSGRMATTLVTGGKAILLAPLYILQAIRKNLFQQEMRRWLRQSGIWLHLLLVQLFDLAGGPEICQFVMHLGMSTTRLTAAELTAVQTIFGRNNLRYQDVRLAEGGILNIIFRYNGGLAFATWYTVHLPRVANGMGDDLAGNGRDNLALLVHEITHIFQYHHVGSRYLGEAIYYLIITQRDCYQYGGVAGLRSSWQQGKTFPQFNREQQAQIIQDYFVMIQTEQDISAYIPYLAQLQQRNL